MFFYPKRTNHHAAISVVLLYLLTAVCIVGIVLERGSAIGWQITGGIAVLIAAMITNRYLMTKFLYALTPPKDLHVKNTLSIVRVVGKRKKTLAMVNLQSVKAFLPLSELKKLVRESNIKRYAQISFCADLFPNNAWALYTESGTDGVAVLLQCDDALLRELRSRLAQKE